MARRFTNSKGTGHGSNLSMHDVAMMKERKLANALGLSHTAYRKQIERENAEAAVLQQVAAEQAFDQSIDDVFADALSAFEL